MVSVPEWLLMVVEVPYWVALVLQEWGLSPPALESKEVSQEWEAVLLRNNKSISIPILNKKTTYLVQEALA